MYESTNSINLSFHNLIPGEEQVVEVFNGCSFLKESRIFNGVGP